MNIILATRPVITTHYWTLFIHPLLLYYCLISHRSFFSPRMDCGKKEIEEKKKIVMFSHLGYNFLFSCLFWILENCRNGEKLSWERGITILSEFQRSSLFLFPAFSDNKIEFISFKNVTAYWWLFIRGFPAFEKTCKSEQTLVRGQQIIYGNLQRTLKIFPVHPPY